MFLGEYELWKLATLFKIAELETHFAGIGTKDGQQEPCPFVFESYTILEYKYDIDGTGFEVLNLKTPGIDDPKYYTCPTHLPTYIFDQTTYII